MPTRAVGCPFLLCLGHTPTSGSSSLASLTAPRSSRLQPHLPPDPLCSSFCIVLEMLSLVQLLHQTAPHYFCLPGCCRGSPVLRHLELHPPPPGLPTRGIFHPLSIPSWASYTRAELIAALSWLRSPTPHPGLAFDTIRHTPTPLPQLLCLLSWFQLSSWSSPGPSSACGLRHKLKVAQGLGHSLPHAQMSSSVPKASSSWVLASGRHVDCA